MPRLSPTAMASWVMYSGARTSAVRLRPRPAPRRDSDPI
jgi:hypothetical protein